MTKRWFGKGTRYDLKVVLRGDIGTGKSALLRRLRGGGFSATYEPRHASRERKRDPLRLTPAQRPDCHGQDRLELRGGARRRGHSRGVGRGGPVRPTRSLSPVPVLTAAAQSSQGRGSGPAGDGAPRQRLAARGGQGTAAGAPAERCSRAAPQHEVLPLDATLLDVYAQAQAVVFLVGPAGWLVWVAFSKLTPFLDPSKPWTADYVVRELARTPLHVRATRSPWRSPHSCPSYPWRSA